jgi:hypothetical protein
MAPTSAPIENPPFGIGGPDDSCDCTIVPTEMKTFVDEDFEDINKARYTPGHCHADYEAGCDVPGDGMVFTVGQTLVGLMKTSQSAKLRVQGNSEVTSSVFTRPIDHGCYSSLMVKFDYQGVNLDETDGDKFHLEYRFLPKDKADQEYKNTSGNKIPWINHHTFTYGTAEFGKDSSNSASVVSTPSTYETTMAMPVGSQDAGAMDGCLVIQFRIRADLVGKGSTKKDMILIDNWMVAGVPLPKK